MMNKKLLKKKNVAVIVALVALFNLIRKKPEKFIYMFVMTCFDEPALIKAVISQPLTLHLLSGFPGTLSCTCT